MNQVAVSWGRSVISNGDAKKVVFKDVCVGNNWCYEWDWKLNNTNHDPGISLGDVEHLDCEIVILSTGFEGRLKCTKEAMDFLKKNKIEVFQEKTPVAVELFNEIVKDFNVAALIHSTC